MDTSIRYVVMFADLCSDIPNDPTLSEFMTEQEARDYIRSEMEAYKQAHDMLNTKCIDKVDSRNDGSVLLIDKNGVTKYAWRLAKMPID